MLSSLYQMLRSVSDNHVFVICYDGRFDELRARDGYALVRRELAVFNPQD